MTKEHISFWLEITSFFLVTLDLYGKDRLTNLNNKLRALNIKELKNETSTIVSFGIAAIFFIGLLIHEFIDFHKHINDFL